MQEADGDNALAQACRALEPGPFLDRRLGRALAFQALYEVDLGHHPPAQIFERLSEAAQGLQQPPYSHEVVQAAIAYATQLVQGALAHGPEIDAVIHERAPAWPLAQMSAVDRNVLRIGLYESVYGGAKVPVKAAINEAVELAKLFGSETSAKFVNGVLGRAIEASTGGAAAHQTSQPTPSAGGALPAEIQSSEQAPEAEGGTSSGV